MAKWVDKDQRENQLDWQNFQASYGQKEDENDWRNVSLKIGLT